MKKIRQILCTCLLLLVFCSGCASGHWVWYKQDMSNFQQDNYQCSYDANAQRFWGYLAQWQWNQWYEFCMKSKGYVWVKE